MISNIKQQNNIISFQSDSQLNMENLSDADLYRLANIDDKYINLNQSFPLVTNRCFFDIRIGDSPPQRIEISLFGISEIVFLYFYDNK